VTKNTIAGAGDSGDRRDFVLAELTPANTEIATRTQAPSRPPDRPTNDLTLSNSLVDLAARINTEHEAAGKALKRSLQHAMVAGELLCEAKAQLKHGQWLPWLKDHCQIPERTARLYMRVAKNKAEIGNVADLTVRGAVALLASPLDSFVAKVADAEIETLDLAAAERASSEIAKRFNAYLDAADAIEEIIALGGNTSPIGRAVWDQLGNQLTAALDHCTKELKDNFDLPFAICAAATAAVFDARDIALEMLRLVRSGEVVAP
jgi:Protein of unknown function (DUF3102)